MGLNWIPDPDKRTVGGTTTEGFPFDLTLYFAPGAPDGAQPIRANVVYQASDDVPGDGYNSHIIEQQPDGTYRRDDGETAANLNDLMPAVVNEGEWDRQHAVLRPDDSNDKGSPHNEH
jgi:hypothetical protein